MRPYILAESNWKTLKDATFNLAVLPWGATEAHNYHLPYATDNIQAEHIAAEAARLAWEEGARVVILPAVPFGVNTGQPDIYLDLNLNPSTQQAILRDLITVLDRQGLHKLLILNGHGGNDFKPMVRELGLAFPDMFLCVASWFQALDRDAFFDEPGDHADELETSLMLHLRPDLVRPLDEAGSGQAKRNTIDAFAEGWIWAERPWSTVTEDTGVGNPKRATREKGAAYFEAVTQKISRLFIDLAAADPDELYA